VKADRAEFKLLLNELDPARIVFLDESFWRLGAKPRYGWSRVGHKAVGFEKLRQWRQVTMLGAMRLTGVPTVVNIEATTTSEVFRAFVQQALVPTLSPGDYVIMDNLSAHKDKQALAAIRAAGACVVFLPPYSPDFNPIEKLWAKIKEFVRRQPTDTREQTDEAVAQAMSRVTDEDQAGWIGHCGYRMLAA